MKNSGGTESFTSLYLALRDQADDLGVERVGAAVGHELADGVGAEVELLGEGLVDDRHPRRAEPVGGGELAPASSCTPSVSK